MKDFEAYRKGLFNERFSASLLMMAIPFYLSFSIIDFISARQFWFEFLLIRVFTACVFLIVIKIRGKGDTPRFDLTLSAHLCQAVMGLGIAYMTFRTGGLSSHYYAGLNWVAIGSVAFWPCRFREIVQSAAAIYGPLLLFSIFSDVKLPLESIALPITFMAGTVLLTVTSNTLTFRSLEREFGFRSELESLIKNKDLLIETKSGEAAQLKRLAKQFSPAVIRAIESGTLSLDQRVRRNIAVIFIDVVGSSRQSHQVDYVEYQKALDLFFTHAMKKFLDNNITVANFMGDGLMAIVNAPYEVDNFEKIAVRTVIEIIRDTRGRQRAFKDYWHENFSIRGGIASGFATVGFFPNSDFGLYTALGEIVNLASRFCAIAEPNSVAASKSIVVAAAQDLNDTVVRSGGSNSNLKGFSGDEREYFVITPNFTTEENAHIEICPLCSSPLTVASDLGDCLLVKCTSCQYSDLLTKAEPLKKIA